MTSRPELDIKIIREGNSIKLSMGKYELKLLPTKEDSQHYDFVALESFITVLAKFEYGKIVKREQIKEDLKSLATVEE